MDSCPFFQGCTSAVFFEVRKKLDLYLWLSKSPDGPSVKFLVENSECLPNNTVALPSPSL
jgi:hypothetical protein